VDEEWSSEYESEIEEAPKKRRGGVLR